MAYRSGQPEGICHPAGGMPRLLGRRPGTLALGTAALVGLLCLAGCGTGSPAQQVPGGDPGRGVADIQHYGCGSCHMISGVDGANGNVGPPLSGIGTREYIAGRLRNTPPAMIQWIRFPQQVVPGVDMPDMGVTDADARDIASYLYTLR